MILMINDKEFIDSNVTYYIVYYHDEMNRLNSLSDISDVTLLQYQEFGDLMSAHQYQNELISLYNDMRGTLHTELSVLPIEKSLKYTNELPFPINYN